MFHNKTNLSPEGVGLGSEFLKNLAKIAPTYIIAGNHDVLLNSPNRLDAITPIVEAIQHSDLFYLKKSQEVHIDENICLNALVITESPETWVKISNPEKINIALFHRTYKSEL